MGFNSWCLHMKQREDTGSESEIQREVGDGHGCGDQCDRDTSQGTIRATKSWKNQGRIFFLKSTEGS